MVYTIEFKDEIKRAKKILKGYQRKVIPRAAVRALNRTAITVRKEAKKELPKQMGIKQAHIRDAFYLTKANLSRMQSIVGVRFKPLALTKFKNTRQLKRGVTSKAWGTRKLYPHAFIAQMNSGHKGVYLSARGMGRKGRISNVKYSEGGHRYRSAKIVKQLYGPSPSRAFAEKEMEKVNNMIARKRFGVVFQQEINFRAKKLNAR